MAAMTTGLWDWRAVAIANVRAGAVFAIGAAIAAGAWPSRQELRRRHHWNGIAGSAQSFSPNPAMIPAGQMVVWHNVDTITHGVVLDDPSIDTGNLDPGAFSSPMFLEATGAYHCTIHPVMVGTIRPVVGCSRSSSSQSTATTAN
jgi:plastocyanin